VSVFGAGWGGGISGPDTLRANREGRLTTEQASYLGKRARRARIGRVVKSGFGLVVAGLTAAFGFSYPPVTLADILVPVAIATLSVVVFRPWSDPLGSDVRAGRVEMVGAVPRVPRVDLLRRLALALLAAGWNSLGSWERDDRILVIGSVRFMVPEDLSSAIGEENPVRAYYLPRSKTLLSAEPAGRRMNSSS